MQPSREEWFDALAAKQGRGVQERLSRATVAVCGAGGLGSNIALCLARAGVGKLVITDFDKVDLTNLHRQQYKACQIGQPKARALVENLREVAPYVEYESHVEKIDEENILSIAKDADVVCEAFDNPVAKAMLVNAVLEKLPEKYLVAASGMASMESSNSIKTRKVSGRFYLCGDFVSDVKDADGLFPSRVMLCAAHQAHMVIRILSGKFEV